MGGSYQASSVFRSPLGPVLTPGIAASGAVIPHARVERDMSRALVAEGGGSPSERDSAWYGNLASARTETLLRDLIESGLNEVASPPTPSTDARLDPSGAGAAISTPANDGR